MQSQQNRWSFADQTRLESSESGPRKSYLRHLHGQQYESDMLVKNYPGHHQRTSQPMCKVTESKSVFPTDDSLQKMVYLAMMEITKKWTRRRHDWGLIHS